MSQKAVSFDLIVREVSVSVTVDANNFEEVVESLAQKYDLSESEKANLRVILEEKWPQPRVQLKRIREDVNDNSPNKKTLRNDEIESSSVDADKNEKLNTLLAQMESYIQANASTTGSKAKDKCSKNINATILDVFDLLSLHDIPEVEPLTNEQWVECSSNFLSANAQSTKEKQEIHPVVQAIVKQALKMCDSSIVIEFERPVAQDEDIVKKPDGSAFAADEVCRAITAMVVALEIKLPRNLSESVCQSLGYLVARLRGQLDLINPVETEVYGYCLGFDGARVVLGYAEVRNLELNIFTSDLTGMELWPFSDQPRPQTETLGFKALRTLFAASLKQLGHTLETLVIDNCIKLTDLLGKGSFCNVFAVQLLNTNQSEQCVLKKPIYTPIMKHRDVVDQLNHMAKEKDLLQKFTDVDADFVPKLISFNLHSEYSPYLLLAPAGIPLAEALHRKTKAVRAQLARKMLVDCQIALNTALKLGFCHSDIGTTNIVYAGDNFVLVDWGLARPARSPTHNYDGRIGFMDDVLVRYVADATRAKVMEGRGRPNVSPSPPLYLPEYDVKALEYVAYAMQRGKSLLKLPWNGSAGNILIDTRRKWIAAGPYAADIQ